MIGKNQIEISGVDFVKGMSSSSDIADGGFSNETDQVNLTYNPGILYAAAAVTDKSTGMTGEVVDSAADSTGTNARILVSKSGTGTGEYFTYDTSGTLTSRQTDAATTYTSTTQLIAYQSDYFCATSTEIVKITGPTLGTIDKVWWTTTKGKGALTTGTRHPMVIFEGSLWIGDMNGLHKWDGTTATEDFLLLNSSETIVALGVDAGSGRMLISTTQQSNANSSGTFPVVNKIFMWDGVATTLPSRAVLVDDTVTAFYSVGGTTYITYGQRLGYWNGSGISFLRKFKNVTLSVNDLAYKRAITNVGNTLYVADGKQVLAYGEILPGQKRFYYAQSNKVSSAKYTHICHLGSGVLGLFFSSAKFYTVDTTSVTPDGYGMSFVTNKYNFPRPVYIRSIYMEYADAVINNDGNRALYIRTDNVGDGYQSLSTLQNTTGASVYFTENIIGLANNKVRFFQLRYLSFSTAVGLKRIIVYYDPAE